MKISKRYSKLIKDTASIGVFEILRCLCNLWRHRLRKIEHVYVYKYEYEKNCLFEDAFSDQKY